MCSSSRTRRKTSAGLRRPFGTQARPARPSCNESRARDTHPKKSDHDCITEPHPPCARNTKKRTRCDGTQIKPWLLQHPRPLPAAAEGTNKHFRRIFGTPYSKCSHTHLALLGRRWCSSDLIAVPKVAWDADVACRDRLPTCSIWPIAAPRRMWSFMQVISLGVGSACACQRSRVAGTMKTAAAPEEAAAKALRRHPDPTPRT